MGYSQISLPIFVVSLIANITLIIIVLQYAEKNSSRTFFSLFGLSQIFWITSNYFAFSVPINLFLLVSRLTMFFATFHALFFLLFVKNFLSEQKTNVKKVIIPITTFGILVSITTFTTLIFKNLAPGPDGILAPQAGPLIPLFGIYVAFCVISGFVTMSSEYSKADEKKKPQWKFLLIGFIFTFLLVLFFSFLNFIFFHNLSGVQFGHLYTLPFVAFTAYAMIKHKLLNVKAVVAEIMVIILNSIIFVQLVNSQSTIQFIISGLVLLGTVIGGIFLIRSVEKEVQQREELQILTLKLQDANEKLKALDIARSEFITIASHQLRTPPATIKWYLSALLNGDYGKFTEEQKTILSKTDRTNNSLISLIDDMLNVSRIERGKMEFLFAPSNLLDLAQITFDQLLPIALEKKLKLTFEHPKTLPSIMADKEKIRQVMNNLIDNALKYTKQGEVKVKIMSDGTNIIFSVTDSGKGISPEEQDSIFQKFSRGKESIKQSAGMGLGLYVAKIVIEQHKGKIWAESPGVGKGSSFIFSVPINNNLTTTTLLDLTQNQS